MLTLRQMRRDAAGVAVLVAAAAGLVAWTFLPSWSANARTMPTGAGFSVVVSQPGDHAAARTVAASFGRAGLPAFTRTLRGGEQIVVGPFVDLADAERAQRRLASRRYRTRLIVDESVRREPGFGGIPTPGAGVQMLLVAGGGRLSVVMELAEEPRQVTTRRVSPDVLEVDIRPAPPDFQRQRWATPEGLELVTGVLVDDVIVDGRRVLRARLFVSQVTLGSVRTLGRRLYIDLWESSGLESRALAARKRPPPAGRALAARQPAAAGVEGPPYETQIAPAVARFQQMQPFVLSSAAAPSPDVLAALDGALRGLERWVQEIEAPAESVARHATLVASVKLAREAVAPEFSGDRAARAREAFALLGS